jgi:ribosomal protein S18 acetylase RimI-like enzyme
MSDVSVRRARPTDAPKLGQLGTLLVREHYEFDPKRFIPVTAQTEQRYGAFLVSQLEEPKAVLLVAERDGQVLGYTYASVEGYDYMSLRGPAGVLNDIVVDPPERGRGIGRMLLEATVDALKARGVPRVVLSTAQQNAEAQHLFERSGFRRTMIEMTRDVD